MIRRTLSLAAFILLGLTCSAAQAFIIDLNAKLSGTSEVPANQSLGSGLAALTFDTDTRVLSWNIVFSGLTGPATAAHFHGPAPVGVNAPVKLDIGAISGLGSPMIGSFDFDLFGPATLENIIELAFGLWYINIHTAAFPGGEIRGQVFQGKLVPEPEALLLLGIALVAVVARRRRE